LHCCLTARRSWVRFPHGVLLALGGRSSPECTVLRWAISRAFLCGMCMFCPCSQGFSSTKNPNSSLHLVPGRLRLPTAPGVLEEGQSGMGKCRSQIHGDHGLCVCVCVCVRCHHLIYARVCS